MILRKPYKFLIKNFRLIHLVLAIMGCYLLIKTSSVIGFFNEYLNSNQLLLGNGATSEYFNIIMFLSTIILLIGNIIILIIMKMKNKPSLFYTINLATYLLTLFVLLYDQSIIEQLQLHILDIRTIKLVSDFTLICFIIQTISTIILIIRAIGFNIKKFNFTQDLELEINENDSEEFELDINVDKNKIKRNVRKNIRNIKYIYSENKFIINIIICFVIFATIIFIILNKQVFNKIYKQNSLIKTTEFNYIVEDSYLVNTDYRENVITDNNLVVIKLKIKNKQNEKKKFETGRIELHIGKIYYKHTDKYKNLLKDLGNVYTNSNIKDEDEYLLVFEIPKNYKDKKIILKYYDVNKKVYKTKLKLKKFNEERKLVKTTLGNDINIDDNLYKNIKFNIKNYEIDSKIKSSYNFCETKDKCYESYEYITPNLSGNYNKNILKIEGSIDLNNQKIKNINDISDLIELFGTIKYTVNNENKEMNTVINEVKPSNDNNKNIYYFEVYSDIKDASKISLILNIRNQKYEYVLK